MLLERGRDINLEVGTVSKICISGCSGIKANYRVTFPGSKLFDVVEQAGLFGSSFGISDLDQAEREVEL